MDFYFQSDLRGGKATVAFSAEKCYHKSVFSKQVLRYEDTKESRQETRRDQPKRQLCMTITNSK